MKYEYSVEYVRTNNATVLTHELNKFASNSYRIVSVSVKTYNGCTAGFYVTLEKSIEEQATIKRYK